MTIKKIIFLFLFIFSSLHSFQGVEENRIALLTTIQREAENIIWQQKLTPEQLQLLLNYCCCSYALVLDELKLVQESAFILPMAWHMRYNNEEPMITPENLLTLERSFIRFSNLYKARAILRTALENFSKELEKTENKIIQDIIKQMKNHCTHLVTYFSNQESQAIEKALEDAATILAHAGNSFAKTSGTYTSLYEKTYPLSYKNPNAHSLETLETALILMPTIAQEYYQAMHATDLIEKQTKNVQEFGALAFYIYYKVTYDGMKQRGIDDKYFGMLFENNILISTDPKTRTLKEPIFDTNIPFFNH